MAVAATSRVDSFRGAYARKWISKYLVSVYQRTCWDAAFQGDGEWSSQGAGILYKTNE